jgi:SAM-dependent methyltransferase
MSRRYAPATARNRDAILAVLKRVLPAQGKVLEIASGTGEHVVHFAAALPGLTFLPSDLDEAALGSIAAWIAEAGLNNVQPPLRLDAREDAWPDTVDAIFTANMIHIAPWEAALGLFRGAGRSLRSGGVLVIYGPFRIAGAHTAPSNQAFDEELRARDPRWGVRDLEALQAVAAEHGLALEERVPMPANNQTLIFRRA